MTLPHPPGFRAAFVGTLRAILAERYAVLAMIGAVVLYSVFYPSAYRHQVASDLPAVVVDEDHSPASRELIRKLDAVHAIRLTMQPASMREAYAALLTGQAEGILQIPAGFERDIRRGRPGQLALLGDGAFLGRAGTVLGGFGDAIGGFAVGAGTDQARYSGAPTRAPLAVVQRPLFNTQEGYGSAIVPGVAELIVHQTLLLGIGVLFGARRLRTGRRLACPPRELAGMLAAFSVIGAFGLLYYSGLTFWAQDYPRGGNLPGLLVAGTCFIAATVSFGMFIGSFFDTRERALQYVTATSLPLFFLANLSWPASSTPDALLWLARLLPSTAGMNVMVQMNQMGATTGEAMPRLLNLAALALLYGALTVWRFRAAAPARATE